MTLRLTSLLALVSLAALTACSPAATGGAKSSFSDAASKVEAGRPAESKPAAPAPAVGAPAEGAPAVAAPSLQDRSGAVAKPAPAAPVGQAPPRPAPTIVPPPAPPPPAGREAPAPALPAITMPSRMVIYNTDLTLLVKDMDQTVESISNIAVLHGGYLAGVENTNEAGLPASTIRIKVLPDRYLAAMNQLRGLAIEVRGEKASTQDVTEEYSDVQTQLASLEATHRQLLDLLSRATTMEEILKIQQQSAQVKLQIDRLRGRVTALERLSELATITARIHPAEAFLARDYSAVRGQLRQAQGQQSSLLLALRRARTPEEENGIRDKLSELSLQMERSRARLKEIERKAAQAELRLPIAPPDETASGSVADDRLQDDFIKARVELRQGEARQTDLTRRLKQNLPTEEQAALRQQLGETILEINRLTSRLKSIQDRAAQVGVVLPTLTPEQEAALAGTPSESAQPDPIRAAASAWEASLSFLRAAFAGVLSAVVFLWWATPVLVLGAFMIARRRLARESRLSGATETGTLP